MSKKTYLLLSLKVSTEALGSVKGKKVIGGVIKNDKGKKTRNN